jgi:hypothetical protein
MSLRKFICLSLLVMAFALPALAQQPTIEYGQPAELRGVTKIFVDTGADIQQRNLIVKAIQKRLPNLEVVSRPEESDIHLRFSLIQAKDGKTKEAGEVVKLTGSNHVRILYSVNDLVFSAVERDSTTGFAKDYAKPYLLAVEFVKAYKKANAGS